MSTIVACTILLGGVFQSPVEAASDFSFDQGNKAKVEFQFADLLNIGSQSNMMTTFQLYWNEWFSKNDGEEEKSADNEQVEKPEEEQVEEPKEEVVQPNKNEEEQVAPETNKQDQQQEGLSQFEQEVVDLTNDERSKQGLQPLEADVELSVVARDKSQDMQNQNYFDHTSPTYGSPFDMMGAYGISYQAAGENIARGQTSPEEVVNGWMNSQGHRENILNGDFTHIGVGFVEQGNYWTQMFIGK